MISRPVRDNVPQSPRLSHQQLMRMPSHQLRLQRAADGILRLMPVAQGVTDRTTPPPYSQRSYLSLNSLPGSQLSFREPTPHPDCGLTNRSSSTLTRSCPPDSTRRLSFSEKRRFGLAWKRPRGPTTRAAHPSASRGAAAPSHRFCDREQWRGQPFHHPRWHGDAGLRRDQHPLAGHSGHQLCADMTMPAMVSQPPGQLTRGHRGRKP